MAWLALEVREDAVRLTAAAARLRTFRGSLEGMRLEELRGGAGKISGCDGAGGRSVGYPGAGDGGRGRGLCGVGSAGDRGSGRDGAVDLLVRGAQRAGREREARADHA